MPIAAYALVTLFTGISVVLGLVAWRLIAGLGGPTARRGAILPIVAAFATFYLIGHRLGIALGPAVPLLGFSVTLLGDIALGAIGSLAAAVIQALVAKRTAAPAEDVT
ncbi:MAG: hypothetical protein ACJ77N_03705 [Chloroflexota bacterium]|jgi:hypothetical protein